MLKIMHLGPHLTGKVHKEIIIGKTVCVVYFLIPQIVLETHVPFHSVELFRKKMGYEIMFTQEAREHAGGIWVLSNRWISTSLFSIR